MHGSLARVTVMAIAVAVACASASATCPSPISIEDFGPLNQNPFGITTFDGHVLVADLYGLSIFQSAGQVEPRVVSKIRLGPSNAVVMAGSYAYVRSSRIPGSTLNIIDVSDKTSPSLVGSLPLSGFVHRYFAVSGPTVFVAQDRTVDIIDASDPTRPHLVGQVEILGPWHVVPSGSLLYVTSDRSLRVVDVSDRSSPTVVAEIDPFVNIEVPQGQGRELFARDLAIEGNRAYLAFTDHTSHQDRVNGFVVLDLTNPTGPAELGHITFPQYTFNAAAHGSFVFVGSGDGVTVVDVSDPTTPSVIVTTEPRDVWDLHLEGDVLYAVRNNFGWSAINVSDPRRPEIAASFESGGRALDVGFSGSTAVVASDMAVDLVDTSDPRDPFFIARLALPEDAVARSVEVVGDLAYVPAGSAGLIILDVSDPYRPIIVGRLDDLPSEADRVATAGDLACILVGFGSNERLVIADISDPHNPQQVGSLLVPSEALAVTGRHAVIAPYFGGSGALRIVDFSDPTAPTVVGLGSINGSGMVDVAIAGDFAYVLGNQLFVVDISDVTAPETVAAVRRRGSRGRIRIVGRNLFVAGEDRGIQVFDITEPARPVEVAHYGTGVPAKSVGFCSETGTLWVPEALFLEGFDLTCGTCSGLEISVTPETILNGGSTADVVVTVHDLLGNPVQGQVVSGLSDLGSVGPFTDNGDGTYSAVFASGASSGRATLSVIVNGEGDSAGGIDDACRTTGEVVIGREPRRQPRVGRVD